MPGFSTPLGAAVDREGARSVGDLPDRRTRLGLRPEARAAAAAPAAERALAGAGRAAGVRA